MVLHIAITAFTASIQQPPNPQLERGGVSCLKYSVASMCPLKVLWGMQACRGYQPLRTPHSLQNPQPPRGDQFKPQASPPESEPRQCGPHSPPRIAGWDLLNPSFRGWFARALAYAGPRPLEGST